MTYRVARTTPLIQVITAFVIVATAGCFVGVIYSPIALAPAMLLLLVTIVCYLTAPTEYELVGDRLTVFTHLGSTTFTPIVNCYPVTRSIWIGVRLFGNGGVFAGTGFFWSSQYGVYRAYITGARRVDMLMVETPRQKVLITPENPQEFLAACQPAAVSTSA